MAGFDKILKKGKDKVQGPTTKIGKIQQILGSLLYQIQSINYMYGKDDMHHIAIKQEKCDKCSLATFIALVRDPDNPKQLLKYHPSDWTAIADDIYRCDRCAGKKKGI